MKIKDSGTPGIRPLQSRTLSPRFCPCSRTGSENHLKTIYVKYL